MVPNRCFSFEGNIKVNYLDYLRANRDESLAGLMEFLSIASVSADPSLKSEIDAAANFVLFHLACMGMDNAKLIESEGQHPIVYADWRKAPGKPTIIIYGHYDVQPPDPLELWETPPFSPSIRNGNVYARGAVDDKGQVYLVLKALESWFATTRKLPVNVIVLIEGEEETGGEHIESWLHANGAALGGDAVLICDTAMFAPGLPTLTTGLRGIIYAEIECLGAAQDLHSGLFGGVAPNPLKALSRIIAGLEDEAGVIQIPGIYDSIVPPSPKELKAWAKLSFSEVDLLKDSVGAKALVGESSFTVLERLWARPSFEVHGMPGGFTGEGPKTVIPAKATAKVSIRLVPGMDPQATLAGLTAQVAKLTPPGIASKVVSLHGVPAMVVDPDNAFMDAAATAMQESFARETTYVRSGGSIPVSGSLSEICKVPVIMAGFGLPDDRIHSPNEKFNIGNFHLGAEAIARFFELVSKIAVK